MAKANDKGSVERGDAVINGSLEATAGKDSQDEKDLAPSPAVMEENTSVGPADRIKPKVIKPSENIHVTGGKAKAQSQEEP